MDKKSEGSARARGGRLIYTAPKGFRGTDQIELVAKGLHLHTRATVGAPRGLVVRALGDSVTAGFGYYASGKKMVFDELLDCRPAAKKFNDACSSNSLNEETQGRPGRIRRRLRPLEQRLLGGAVGERVRSHQLQELRDQRLGTEELGGGRRIPHPTEKVEAEDPDYILLTLGANPLLSNVLFGLREHGVRDLSPTLPEYRDLRRRRIRKVELRRTCAASTRSWSPTRSATIYLMQYHLSIPWSALAYSSTQIAMMGKLLNLEIAAAAAEVGSSQAA